MSAEHTPQLIVVGRGAAPPPSAHGGVAHERRFQIRELLEALTAVALVVYGAVHFGQYAFYARLGVSPDAVGLDYGRTLGAVAVGLALFVAAIVFLLTAGALFTSNHGSGLGRFVLGLVVGGVGAVLLRTLLPPLPNPGLAVSIMAATAAGAVLNANHVALRAWASGLGGRATLAIAAPAIVLAFGLAGLAGYHAAGYVYRGGELPCGCTPLFGRNITLPWVSGSRGFMGVEAERAEVEWVNPSEPHGPLPADPIYLGTADNMVVLYDPTLHRAVRIPAQSISVETTPRVISWKEPR
jgi:hypothetical protein